MKGGYAMDWLYFVENKAAQEEQTEEEYYSRIKEADDRNE
jgi:hypothetical protein